MRDKILVWIKAGPGLYLVIAGATCFAAETSARCDRVLGTAEMRQAKTVAANDAIQDVGEVKRSAKTVGIA
ncbi:hypothetical protein FHX06_003413 [Rhizobium sp. BK512]|nr:hypothetical protein [Rhizobium sp. BK512]